MIRPATPNDAERICDIYNHYIQNSIFTFEETPVSTNEMRRRILEIAARLSWLVYESDHTVVGFAYAGPWKSRSAYRFSVESTIYLAPDVLGRGIGYTLYQTLIRALRPSCHCVIAGIALPNAASVALHERCEFVQVAHFKQVGYKLGRWIDVGYWQLILTQPV